MGGWPRGSDAVPDPFLALLRNHEQQILWLSEITGAEPAEVRCRLQRELGSLGSNVREAVNASGLEPHVWSERLAEFYGRTEAFLYETLVWNQTSLKNRMRQWSGRWLQTHVPPRAKILTFGDGLGIDSLYLAVAGYAVDYFEISPCCARFAQRLSAALSQPLNVITTREAILPGAYDAVVCWDVLEHVPDPEGTVEQLVAYLKPNGRLLVHAPFWFVHPTVVTHLRTNRRFSGELRRLYGARGLRLIDGRCLWNPLVFEKTEESRPRARLPSAAWLAVRAGQVLFWFSRYWGWPLAHFTVSAIRRDLRQLAAGTLPQHPP